ncbi:MAG TPA: RecQ family ATP-dependent DNA helicase [Pirellulales bacterium]|nr:RecQ family ATP-dependent DNA helicase [Pirellulales bacterium]
MVEQAEIVLESLLPKFGLSSFRPGQLDVIRSVVEGHDCLCVMPTGGGKSLCYQLPAIARPGVTLVVSPLIALMKDQVDQLHSLNLSATLINSTLSPAEQAERLDGLARGAYQLVYVVPERFRSPRFVDAVRSVRLNLLAIDEAHCISQWGHDFRPDYAKLGRFRQQLGNPPTIALTATATDAVRRDIVEQLSLRTPRTFITGFARPNLHYAVQCPTSAKRKDRMLIEFIQNTPGSGIIYASSRKRCEEVADLVASETGRSTGVYHAGMQNEDRRKAQDEFMSGRKEIVVATTAFGMGIDKADVRFVVHYNLPGSLEGYYQEAGRAGRDGLPAQCLLLFSYGDRRIQEFFIESRYPAREMVALVYDFLRGMDQDPIELTQQEIKERLNLPIGAEGVGACEQLLEKAGVLERLEPCENMALVRLDSDQPTLVDLLPPQARTQRRVMQALEQLVGNRRWELVYFNPRDLMAMTELDAPAVARTLRELRELKSFDYVPPFRGRSVHLLETRKPFSQLDLDFKVLEERKAAEYEKLNRVINMAQGPRCREQEILEYFGQTDSQPCGRCDNCQRPFTRSARPSERPSTSNAALVPGVCDAVRVALSGVARTRGRFGKIVIAQMLCGSRSTKVAKLNLQRLSTYGMLRCLKQDGVADLLSSLMDARCIEQFGENDRPRLRLTESGQEVMAGRMTLEHLPLPAEVVEALRTFRAPGEAPDAKRQASPDASQEIETPTTEAPRVESPPEDGPNLPPAAPPAVAGVSSPKSTTSTPRPSHYWTWRLLSSGFSVSDCQAIRGLDREVVLDHALRAIDSGWPVNVEWFLKPDQIETLDRIIGPTPPARIRPLLSKLPPGLRYEDVQLYLKCRPSELSRPITAVQPDLGSPVS